MNVSLHLYSLLHLSKFHREVNNFIIVLQVADNIPEVRPTPKPRKKPKQNTVTGCDATDLSGNGNESKKFWSHMDKCDKQPK